MKVELERVKLHCLEAVAMERLMKTAGWKKA
jgi:hypothetical protein